MYFWAWGIRILPLLNARTCCCVWSFQVGRLGDCGRIACPFHCCGFKPADAAAGTASIRDLDLEVKSTYLKLYSKRLCAPFLTCANHKGAPLPELANVPHGLHVSLMPLPVQGSPSAPDRRFLVLQFALSLT